MEARMRLGGSQIFKTFTNSLGILNVHAVRRPNRWAQLNAGSKRVGGWVGSESLLFVGIVGIEGPLSAANCQTQIIGFYLMWRPSPKSLVPSPGVYYPARGERGPAGKGFRGASPKGEPRVKPFQGPLEPRAAGTLARDELAEESSIPPWVVCIPLKFGPPSKMEPSSDSEPDDAQPPTDEQLAAEIDRLFHLGVPQNTLAGLQRWHSIWTDRTKLPVINAEMSRFRFLQLLKTFVAHVHTIEGHQFTPGSLKSGISALLRVFNDAHKTNLKLSDPDALETKRIVLGKLRDLINNGHRDGHGAPLVEPPLEAAVAATLNPDSNEDLVAWTLWLLLSKAGLRLKEAQDITLDDLDFQADGALLVRPPGVTKNHQPSVEVDRSPDLIRHLAAPQDVTWFRRLIAARPKKPTTPTKLFLALNRANPQTPFKAQPMGEKLLRKIFHGVFSRVEGGQLITPHSGRRTLQTRAARAGATVAQRLALTGHKSIASLARYETPTTGDMHAVAVKLAAASPAPTPPPPIVPGVSLPSFSKIRLFRLITKGRIHVKVVRDLNEEAKNHSG
ncbi:hypothetical protein PAPYR_13020 [Paratrimastix pyriformis]|uniref:Tyr recombinase domain-containing protein n=1 Tax=Paratrimastix pyriformis TaxID=342808 RepID=A0ABQ8U626_9EUKA|nr:hypothetical protein PAPYR_13020 [Paratrimastix pyriformis]